MTRFFISVLYKDINAASILASQPYQFSEERYSRALRKQWYQRRVLDAKKQTKGHAFPIGIAPVDGCLGDTLNHRLVCMGRIDNVKSDRSNIISLSHLSFLIKRGYPTL